MARSLRNHRTDVFGTLVAGLEPFSADSLTSAGYAVRGSGFELVADPATCRGCPGR